MVEAEARAATRIAQRIASQLHQLIAASLTVTSLRSEREIVENLAGSARRVFDADDAVLCLESADAPLIGVAQRSRLTATYEAGEQVDVKFPALRLGTSAAWAEDDWIVAPIIAGRGVARGVLAVRREKADFSDRGSRSPDSSRPNGRHFAQCHGTESSDREQRESPAYLGRHRAGRHR